ncbi:MAG: hypothetical protein KBE86_03805 [Chitinophagales bacterium]|nr:hypothetical protein [Chitinophagales bacterium]
MKKFIIATFIILSCIIVNAQTCSWLSGLQEGSTWENTLTNAKGEKERTTSYIVENIDKQAEKTVILTKYSSINKKGKEDDNGFIAYTIAKDKYLIDLETSVPGYKSDDPQLMTYNCNAKANDQIAAVRFVSTYTTESMGQKSIISNKMEITDGKYLGMEEVTTALGTMQCMKLTYNLRYDLQDFTYTEWVNDEKGFVKREILDKKGKPAYTLELTTFKN